MPDSSRKLPTSGLMLLGAALLVAIAMIVMLLGRRRDAATEQVLGYMRSDLLGLVMAEQTVRRMTGQYVDNAEVAGHMSTAGVNTPTITLDGNGWSAIVTHKQRPDLKCAVAVGTRNPLSRFADDGEVVCD